MHQTYSCMILDGFFTPQLGACGNTHVPADCCGYPLKHVFLTPPRSWPSVGTARVAGVHLLQKLHFP